MYAKKPISELSLSGETHKRRGVLFVHHGAVPGGAPTSLAYLINGLESLGGLNLAVCCAFRKMRSYFRTVTQAQVIPSPVPCKISGKVFIGWARLGNPITLHYFLKEIWNAPRTIWKERRFLKTQPFDIVHLNSSILWTTAIAAKMANKKIVWHVREVFLGGRTNARSYLYSLFLRKLADAVICISPTEAQSIRGTRDPKVKVVYNSLDFSRFREERYDPKAERKKFGIADHAFVLLSLGGLSFRKGTFQLISAMGRLDADYHLVIAGDATLENHHDNGRFANPMIRFEDFLVRRGWKPYFSWYYGHRIRKALAGADRAKITFTGVVDDVPRLISLCDVMVFAGVTSHFSRPIFEAWAMNRPVLVLDTPSMRNEVTDGVDGMIVKEHTGEKLAEAIAHAKSLRGALREMGEIGSRKCSEKFNLRRNAERVRAVYLSVGGTG